jgi:hypothetical protein
MLDVDPSQLESAVADLQSQLRDGLNRYLLLDLHSDHSAVVVRSQDDLLLVMLIDNTKTTLGILLSVAIPKALATLEGARR